MYLCEKDEVAEKLVQVKVAMATCGIASGARETMEFMTEALEKRGVDAIVTKVGCMGYCYAELTIEVNLPGSEPVVFGGVSTEKTIRKSHENPYILKLYDEFLGEPLSEKAHDLLHTHYFDKRKKIFQEVISEKMEIPAAKVYGVVTFYSFFTMIPKGKHPISICTGTACYVRGAETVLSEFKKQLDIEVGDKTYGRVAPDDVKGIIEEYTT
jgi:NADP-reducing hydrogenase subunit HndB